MAEEQVEVVREHIKAFGRKDAPIALSHLDPYVVLDWSRTRPLDATVAHGHEGITETMRHYIGAFEDYAYEAERLTDLGSGAVLAVVTETGRGKGSGVPVERSFAMLYTVIDGKIARVTSFLTEEDALEAAGLREWAMSQENVELLRAVYAEWAKGNFRAGRELLDPEIELYPLQGLPGAASYHGRQDFLAYVERWLESWDEYRIIPEEFIEAGDQVVVIYRAVGRGKGSGIELDSRFGHIWTILDGSAVRIEMFSSPAEALEAAGLRE